MISISIKILIIIPIIIGIIFKIKDDNKDEKYKIIKDVFFFNNIKEINELSQILDIIVNKNEINDI